MSEKIACYDVSSIGEKNRKNAKIAVIMTLSVTGLIVLQIVLASAGATPVDGINQLAIPRAGFLAILPLLFGLITLVLCGITPPVMAHFALNKKKVACFSAWFWCYLVMAVFITIALVGTIARAGSMYRGFCDVMPADSKETSVCTEQFKYSDTCNHTAPNPFSPQAPGQTVRVSKKYCDSKGMDYEGAWYTEIIMPIFSALLFILTNAVTFYICWAKKDIEGGAGAKNDGGVVTTVATVQIVQPTIVTATVQIVQPTIVKASIQ